MPLAFVAAIFSLATSLSAQNVDPATLPRGGMNVHWANFSWTSPSLPFTDAVKNGSEWLGSPTFLIDANGWPTRLGENEQAQMLIYEEQSLIPSGPDQVYTLMWEGSGRFIVGYSGGAYDFEGSFDGTAEELTFPEGNMGLTLTITETDPENPIHNIRLFLPGYGPESPRWTDHFRAFYRNFGLIRFCWGSGINTEFASEVVEWANRRDADFFTYGDDPAAGENYGVPYEVMIELANLEDIDLWICVPHRASGAFHEALADLLIEHLEPGRRVWIEYSNEVFNWWFPVNAYLAAEAEAVNATIPEPDNHIDLFTMQGRVTVPLFQTFHDRFTAAGRRSDLVNVLSGQNGYAYPLEAAASEVARLGAMDLVDALSIAPYFAIPYDEPGAPADPLRPLLEGVDPAVVTEDDPLWDEVERGLRTLVNHIFDPAFEAGAENATIRELAAQYDKPLVAYEGGQHLHTFYAEGDVAYLRAWLGPINRHPAMGNAMRYFYEQWEAFGGSTLVAFADFFTPNSEEAFGIKENWRQADSDSPKFLATLEWLEAAAPPATLPFPATTDPDLDGWVWSEWFGWVYRGWLGSTPDTSARWIYHPHHGFLFIGRSFQSEQGFWLWHHALQDYVFTGNAFYNSETCWFYLAGPGRWYFFFRDRAEAGRGTLLVSEDGQDFILIDT